MFEFLRTEIQAYVDAARSAAAAYEAGNLQRARQSRATAAIGCATLSRYIMDPWFAAPLTENERQELASALGDLRASLESDEPKF